MTEVLSSMEIKQSQSLLYFQTIKIKACNAIDPTRVFKLLENRIYKKNIVMMAA